MQLSTFLLTALASTALSLPTLSPRVASTWTLVNFTRTYNADDSSAHYSYAINPNDGSALVAISYDVAAAPPANATTTSYALSVSGFDISSSWSGQFGAGKGFSTLAVKYQGYIAYPAYEDSVLGNGTVVSPDRSFSVQALQQAKNVAVQ